MAKGETQEGFQLGARKWVKIDEMQLKVFQDANSGPRNANTGEGEDFIRVDEVIGKSTGELNKITDGETHDMEGVDRRGGYSFCCLKS